MTKNSFKLPDELGWECNDEISRKLDSIFAEASKYAVLPADQQQPLYQVMKAEVMDEVYAIIVKYQKAKRLRNK